jgi:hypothetical protein
VRIAGTGACIAPAFIAAAVGVAAVSIARTVAVSNPGARSIILSQPGAQTIAITQPGARSVTVSEE